MNFLKSLRFLLLATLTLSALRAASVPPQQLGQLSAMATLSRRAAKPGDHLELVVTVRSATHPMLLIPSNPEGLHFQILRHPQLFTVDNQSVWLFRYRVTPKQLGDYEIPALQVADGSSVTQTKPILLHVSKNGELPPLSARELSLGVNIPESLSEEVLKAAPQPTPRPTPSSTPPDTRALGTRALSSCWNGLKAFWNYPGK